MKTMSSKNIKDASMECLNSSVCDMFYDRCGNGNEFRFCEASSASLVDSSCGSILYIHGNINAVRTSYH